MTYVYKPYDPVNGKFVKKLKKQYPELENYPIQDIFRAYNLFLREMIVEYRNGISLPLSLGYMCIGGFPVNSTSKTRCLQNVPQERINELGASNQERDGFEMMLYYTSLRTRHRFGHGRFWGFIPNTNTRSAIRKAFVENWKKYFIVPDIKNLRMIYKQTRNKLLIEMFNKEKLATYNEFEN